jgi:hypothetical protein
VVLAELLEDPPRSGEVRTDQDLHWRDDVLQFGITAGLDPYPVAFAEVGDGRVEVEILPRLLGLREPVAQQVLVLAPAQVSTLGGRPGTMTLLWMCAPGA